MRRLLNGRLGLKTASRASWTPSTQRRSNADSSGKSHEGQFMTKYENQAPFFDEGMTQAPKAWVSGFGVFDKTHIIKDFLDHDSSPKKVIACLRPNGFGKSASLETLRAFFSADERENHQSSHEFFRNSFIWEAEGGKYRKYMNTHPILKLTFSRCDTCVTWQDMHAHLDSSIYEALNDHSYLLKNLRNTYDKIQVEKVLKKEWSITSDDLLVMTRVLEDYYKKKVQVIVLIDDIDLPLRHSLEKGYYTFAAAYVYKVLEKLLWSNDSVFKGIVMGAVGFQTDDIGLRETPYFTLLEPQFSKSLGVMVSEAQRAFEKFGIPSSVRDILLQHGYPSAIVDPTLELSPKPSKVFKTADVISVIKREEVKKMQFPLEMETLRRVFWLTDGVFKSALTKLIDKQDVLVELTPNGIEEERYFKSDPKTLMTYLFYLGIISVMKDQFGLHAKIVDEGKLELLDDILKSKEELDEQKGRFRLLLNALTNYYDTKEIEDLCLSVLRGITLYHSDFQGQLFHRLAILTQTYRKRPDLDNFGVFKAFELAFQAHAEEVEFVPDVIKLEEKEHRCFVPRWPTYRGVLIRKLELSLPSLSSLRLEAEEDGKNTQEKLINVFLENAARRPLTSLERTKIAEKFKGRASDVALLSIAFYDPQRVRVGAEVFDLPVRSYIANDLE